MSISTVRAKRIHITQFDRDRLRRLLERTRHPELARYLGALRAELDRARVVAPEQVPPDVITMNSTVLLEDFSTSESDEYTLVYPEDADADEGKISVMAPLGTAMLGYRVGDIFEWDVPMGRNRWRVAGILYQPEAEGQYHL